MVDRESIRRLLFDDIFIDSRAQDYCDAARRLWTERYALATRLAEAERLCAEQADELRERLAEAERAQCRGRTESDWVDPDDVGECDFL